MWSKRIYKCLYNKAANNFEVHVTDESGLSVRKLNTDDRKDALDFFYVIRDTLAKNVRLEIRQVNAFHFECKKRVVEPAFRQESSHRSVLAIGK